MDDSFRFRSLCHEAIRLFLRCLMLFVFLYSIVNNGNILTEGRDERKYLERKYNELYFFITINLLK